MNRNLDSCTTPGDICPDILFRQQHITGGYYPNIILEINGRKVIPEFKTVVYYMNNYLHTPVIAPNFVSAMRLIVAVALVSFLLPACRDRDNEIGNEKVRVSLSIADGRLVQEYSARAGAQWHTVVKTADAATRQSLQLYDSSVNPGSRFLLSSFITNMIKKETAGDAQRLVVEGSINGAASKIIISLDKDGDHFHVQQQTELGEQTPIEYFLTDLQFEAGTGSPEFVHTPALKFEEDDIVGDRTFWSPAVIMQEKELFAALVPDLVMINDHPVLANGLRPVGTGKNFGIPVDSSTITFPTGLDIRTDTTAGRRAIFSFGYIDAIARHHMHWLHPNDSSMVRRPGKTTMIYGFDLFVSAGKERFYGYQDVSRFIWQKYGSAEYSKGKNLAMPFEEYARLCYPASAAYQGSELAEENKRLFARHNRLNRPSYPSFLSWKMDGVDVGGYRNNAPQWYEMIGNTTWWNNVRDAVGMYQWGERLGDSSLKTKARSVINLVLKAPQQEGAFPGIYKYEKKQWMLSHWGPPMTMDSSRNERYFDSDSPNYHTSGMSKTALHLLRYYKFCEQKPEILAYAERYAYFLHKYTDTSGCVPAFFSKDLQPNPHLRTNGAGGIHIWFLAALHEIDGKDEHLQLAKRIAAYMNEHVLPNQEWKDFEAYFSCGVKPMNFHDHFTSQPPRNTLSTYWAVEGFTALYQATNEEAYLHNAARAADYLSLYQASWQPHYISTAYAFGGFGVQNTDAEWLDARQGEIAPAFVRLGIITGRQDLVERGYAAAKASLILVNHESHKQNNLYAQTNFPTGLGPENIDHEGFPQSPMRTNAGWGEVSGLSGIADILQQTGDLYVDSKTNIAAGFNGIVVKKSMSSDSAIVIENTFQHLPFPYNDTLNVRATIAGGDSGRVNIRTEGKIRLK